MIDDYDDRLDLLKALLRLREDGPRDSLLGICSNVSACFRTTLEECFHELGLDTCFPVAAPDGSAKGASTWYGEAERDQMWSRDHPYGAARWALLDRLIEHLQA